MRQRIVFYLCFFVFLFFASCGKHAVKEKGTLPLPEIRDHSIDQKHKKEKYSHGWWGKHTYTGSPWVQNVSRPEQPSAALSGKHLAVWQSHGNYYDNKKGFWK